MLDLESDLIELCAATGKAQIARTVCRRLASQIDLALRSMPPDLENARHIADLEQLAAERARLTFQLDRAVREATATFQSVLRGAFANDDTVDQIAMVQTAWGSIFPTVERESQHAMRLIQQLGLPVDEVDADPGATLDVQLDLPDRPGDGKPEVGANFGWSEATRIFGKTIDTLGQEKIVGGLEAAKRLFPKMFKGIGPKTFERIAPLVGPAILTVTNVHDIMREGQREKRAFEAEKMQRIDFDQSLRSAAARFEWAAKQECQSWVDRLFGRGEDELSRQTSALRGEAVQLERDRAALLRCRGRLEMLTEN